MSKSLIYEPEFVSALEKKQILDFLNTLHPIWEMRYSLHNPPPPGHEQRQLLRPVYWLGNWQFACLNYYHPPKGIHFRCVEAEPFPPVLQKLIQKIEDRVHQEFLEKDIPHGWHLNTCLINYYGCKVELDKKIDVARVGEHKDFEPGPVASISFGERAFFQFVTSAHKQAQSKVVQQMWLDDRSLQIFGSDRFKKHLFHRVQRVEKKTNYLFEVNTDGFETRRINFTFRYVPNDHIQPYGQFPADLREDIKEYLEQLAQHSAFFNQVLQQNVSN